MPLYQGLVRRLSYKARTLIKTQIVSLSAFLFGGPEEIRTLDPHNANVVRSQLRYRPVGLPGGMPGRIYCN